MTEPEQPADPGWDDTDDGCKADAKTALAGVTWRCELDADHVDRGEPHTLTVVWFDPVAEPDCEACSDTGQVAGEPCPENCARAQFLAGVSALDIMTAAAMDPADVKALVAHSSLGGWAAPDD